MNRAGKFFIDASDRIAWISAGGAALAIAIIPLLILAEILSRAVLNISLGVTWEYATYLMTLTFLLGAAYTLRTGGHIRVTIARFGKNTFANTALEFLACGVGAAFALFLALALTDLAWQSYARGVVSATPDQTPLYLPRAAIALGAWILALQMLARIVAICIGAPLERAPPDAETQNSGPPIP